MCFKRVNNPQQVCNPLETFSLHCADLSAFVKRNAGKAFTYQKLYSKVIRHIYSQKFCVDLIENDVILSVYTMGGDSWRERLTSSLCVSRKAAIVLRISDSSVQLPSAIWSAAKGLHVSRVLGRAISDLSTLRTKGRW